MAEQRTLFADEPCPFCGEEPFVDIFEIYPGTREFEIESCCEPHREWWIRDMAEWGPEEWQRFFWLKAGSEVRSIGGPLERRDDPDHFHDQWSIDAGITIATTLPGTCTLEHRRRGTCPPGALTIDEIREYVRRYHRHAARPPAGGVWGYAVYNILDGLTDDPTYKGRPGVSSKASGQRPVGLVRWPPGLIGVALVGRPGARMTEQVAKRRGEKIAELSRMALNLDMASFLRHKAASMIYTQAAEDAQRMGYTAIQTFVRESESGMSLRYARWKKVASGRGGGQSSRASRPRARRGAELVEKKVLFERRFR